MNYEERYKQALKVASQWHKDGIGDVKTIVECIFPELKESEDERIRKEIIEYITRYTDSLDTEEYNSWLAWLEKQGEQKSWSEEDDIFFADEEEEFTEFEKELKAMIQDIERGDFTDESFDFWKDRLLDLVRKELQQEFDKEMDKMLTETDKYNRDSIIALIQWSESFNSSGMTHDKANQLITWVNSYNPYDIWCHKDSKTFNPTQNQAEFEKGRQDALKDLPKWKKCVGSTGPFLDYNSKGEEYLYLNDYVIKVSELEKLPKEE